MQSALHMVRHGVCLSRRDEVQPSTKCSTKVRALAGDGAGRVPLVEITGGEPLLQPETPALAEKLLGAGYTVMIETSGERFVGVLAARR